MKYILFIVAGVSTIVDLYLRQSLFSFASIMWILAAIVIYDCAMGALNRTSPFMRKFYEEIRWDLFLVVIPFILLAVVFADGHIPILHGVDLAFVGLGLMLCSFRELCKCIQLKVAGKHLPRSIVWILIWIVVIGTGYSAWMLRDIIAENLSPIQSLYLQGTIICTSFYVFYFSSLLRFYLKEERLEPSPVMLKLADVIFGNTDFSQNLSLAAKEFNLSVKEYKREKRIHLSHQRRKKRRKKR